MTAIESSSPANAGMTARPVIQVRSISAAVALSRPKLAHETFAAAASAPGSAADIDTVERDEGDAPHRGRREPSRGHELGRFHRERHPDHRQRRARKQHHHAAD